MGAADRAKATTLIAHWSMAGAERDLTGRLRSAHELRVLFAYGRSAKQLAKTLPKRPEDERNDADP